VEEKVTVLALDIHDAEAGALQAANKRKFKPTTLYFIIVIPLKQVEYQLVA
jgi:hypothetical protein